MCVCHAPEMQLLGLTRLRSKSPPAISEGSLLVPVDPKLDQADLNSRRLSLLSALPVLIVLYLIGHRYLRCTIRSLSCS